jgi:hypothetical protein
MHKVGLCIMCVTDAEDKATKTKKGAESKKRTHVLAICVEALSSMNPLVAESIQSNWVVLPLLFS